MYQVIEFYQQNLQLAREAGQRREELSALFSLARAHDALQEREKAIEFYELALIVAKELGDGRAERDTLKHLNKAMNPEAKQKISKNKPAKTKRAKKSSRKKATKAAPKARNTPPVSGQQ
ncbi:MAG: tetratricopeptide repeat protein [Blastocatellia bacterium]